MKRPKTKIVKYVERTTDDINFEFSLVVFVWTLVFLLYMSVLGLIGWISFIIWIGVIFIYMFSFGDRKFKPEVSYR